ncbi:MAG TPA: DUF4145 domain-containing protein [Steroidobacteraceae bacterium]|jgi:hypothetical protein|nr:DUF4145 domain-containing protein [Steroidobacteraceae bacterium]
MTSREESTTFKVQPPTEKRLLIPCRTCRGDTNHEVLCAAKMEGSDSNQYVDMSWGTDYEVLRCCGCNDVTFLQRQWHSEDTGPEGELNYREELFPNRASNWQAIEHEYLLPEKLRRIYHETGTALNADLPVLALIGTRAIIETVANDRRAAGGNLQRKLDNLQTQGVLTKDGAAILHKLRDLGNSAAHSVTVYPKAQLKLAMTVVEHLLQAVYILPKHAKKSLKASTRKRRKKQAAL